MHRHILIKDASSAEASPAAAKVNSPSSKAITLSSAASLKGELTIPGDKSISHRAIMFSSLAKGDTQITHFLESADCLATMDCFSRLGIYIERDFSEHGKLIVHGTGLRGLYPSHSPIALYSQNSGTTTRIMSGILAPQHFTSYITGDESVNRRPMKRVMEPLQQMGADIISMNDDNCAPLKITGKPLHGITWKTSVASAQVKSAILCAGLYAEGNTTVLEPAISRDHTEKMLAAFGHAPAVTDLTDDSGKFAGHSVSVTPAKELWSPEQITVPGDISSAAYFIAAACLVPNSEVLIRNVGINETRDGILRVARAMGADITVLNENRAAEPSADLLVRTSSLHGTIVEGDMIPTLIDEIPIIAVMAAAADGTTIIRDAAELKVKESDRIAAMTEGLQAMGCRITPTGDGMIIEGGALLRGAAIRTFKDHRIAMSFAIAALIAEGETVLDDAGCVDISYPTFFENLNQLRQ
ncbi:3-phosphoshikimate 1-carboxyvinyltransferase [Firmicutes bacterium CAG:791]|nr:3-phosphoshikimate 1-carboxyvinyltransferase [Firmicutes bacterium CAG:791]